MGKLSYNDQRELDSLPNKMDVLQKEIGSFATELSSLNLFQQNRERYDTVSRELEKKMKELSLAEERWLYLEERKLDLEPK